MTLPILMYHEVEPAAKVDKRYTLSEDAFDSQLQYLCSHGFTSVRLDGTPGAAGPHVAITFDDSHVNHVENSLPLLQRHGLHATFFVVTGFIGQDRAWLTRTHLEELVRAGMAVESHSHTHRFLDKLPDAELRDELVRSKQVLEDWLGTPVRHLSCPGGRHNRRVLDAAARAGYATVSTSIPGAAQAGTQTPGGVTVLPRLLVTGATTLTEFELAVSADAAYLRRRSRAHNARQWLKRSLGDTNYQRLWQLVSRFDSRRSLAPIEQD